MRFPPDILDAVLARSTSHTSSLHGLPHWERVRENGVTLAGATDGADTEVVCLFALFHDSMRLNDGHDPTTAGGEAHSHASRPTFCRSSDRSSSG